MENLKEKNGEIKEKINHDIWRTLKLFRKVDGNPPIIQGLDFLGERNILILGRGNSVGDCIKDGIVLYKMLYTEHNLNIAKTYLAKDCRIEIDADSGLILKG